MRVALFALIALVLLLLLARAVVAAPQQTSSFRVISCDPGCALALPGSAKVTQVTYMNGTTGKQINLKWSLLFAPPDSQNIVVSMPGAGIGDLFQVSWR